MSFYYFRSMLKSCFMFVWFSKMAKILTCSIT
uniref:Uncharacterized protein n=1 Tax=Rhizophora mucronata TaxID=61149 RepID=A0A2P2NPP2_RHIMU